MNQPETGGIRAYSRHRGCRHEAVRRAIATGRLRRSVSSTDGKVQIDFAVADREWTENAGRITKPIATSPDAAVPLEELSVFLLGEYVVLAHAPDADADLDDITNFIPMSRHSAACVGLRLLELSKGDET